MKRLKYLLAIPAIMIVVASIMAAGQSVPGSLAVSEVSSRRLAKKTREREWLMVILRNNICHSTLPVAPSPCGKDKVLWSNLTRNN